MNKNTYAKLSVIGLILVLTSLLLAGGSTALAADEGEVLRVRSRKGQDIQTMDPAFHLGDEEYNINLAIFSRLMKYEPGSQELTLDAAKSVDVSEDGKVVTFELKQGIQFHEDYGELTAEDVKFSYERIIDPENDSPYKSSWRTLDHVEVTGEYTGKLVFDEPLASLFTTSIPYTAGAIVSKEAYEDLGDEFATHPIGSGPYRWKSWTPNQEIVLEKFDDYYGEKPYFDTIEILTIENDKSAEMAFDRGELDDTSISLTSIDRYEGKKDSVIHTLTNLRYHWIGFNVQEAPFDDIKVRKAIRYAVNVDEIIEGAYNGIPERNNCALPPSMVGSWDECPSYEQDVQKAKELLAEAGYPNGFEVDIITSGPDYHSLSAQILQQQLMQIGIVTRIKEVENGYETLRKLPQNMHYYSFSLNLNPGYWFEWFTCDQVGKWNFPAWCSEEFDALLEEAATTMDQEERAEKFVEMQKIMHEEVPLIFVTNGSKIHVTKPEIEPSYLGQYSQYEYFTKAE
ncbi:MAG: ABC transporter substrate-binding protein [Candidatus Bipolaricaulota bacterium]